MAATIAALAILGLYASPSNATPVVVDTIPVGSVPWGVAISPDGARAYVANSSANSVSVINTATNTVSDTITVGNGPDGLAVSPDGTRVYTANTSSMSVIDTSTNTVIAAAVGLANGNSAAVSPDGAKVYVSDFDSDQLRVLDTATNTFVNTINIGALPRGVAVNPSGSRVYVANSADDTVSVIDAATEAVLATVAAGSGPSDVAVSPDSSIAYATNLFDSTVSVIDTTTNTVTDTVPVGSGPWDVSISPDGSAIYTADRSANTVSVVDTTTNSVTDTFAVGSAPTVSAVTPDGTRLYVTNRIDGTVSVAALLRPSAPTGVGATAGDREAAVTWTAPTSTGGSPITGYTATAAPGGQTCTTTGATGCTIDGLTNGTDYTVTVTATSDVGTSDPSSPSNVVTPGKKPGKPTGVQATAGDARLTATWTAPSDNGGRPITGYTATAAPGGATCTTTGATDCTIDGLTNGVVYTVTVTATNVLGTSAPSDPSAPVTPRAAPTPTPTVKKVQKPRDARGKPPASIKIIGTTVLTGSNARTNADQLISTRVRVRTGDSTAQGEVRYYKLIRGPQGKVAIRTYGRPGLTVILLQSAPATDTYRSYRNRAVYVDGVKQ